MFSTWLHPAAFSLLALLWSAAVSPNAPTSPNLQQPPASLTGELLVASPQIGDPRFWHSVILVVRQNDQGAVGIMINRPVGEVPLAQLLQAVGLNDTGVKGTVRIFAGGPVGPGIGFVVHSPDYHRDGTTAIDSRLSFTENPQILEDIAHGHGPRKKLIAFGYAGWAPGQLQTELGRGDWFVIPETPNLVFDDNRDHVWDDAMASRTTQL